MGSGTGTGSGLQADSPVPVALTSTNVRQGWRQSAPSPQDGGPVRRKRPGWRHGRLAGAACFPLVRRRRRGGRRPPSVVGEDAAVDPLSLVAVGYAVKRLGGPSVDTIADALAAMTKHNLETLSERLTRRFGQAGRTVPPRVLFAAVEQGSVLSDPVMQEYLAGLVVSADETDDSAMMWIDLLSRMTTNQVRLHHAIFAALADQISDPTSMTGGSFTSVTVVVDTIDFLLKADKQDDEVIEAVAGLSRLDLIHGGWTVGIEPQVPGATAISMQVSPAYLGYTLFLRAYGDPRSVEALAGFQADQQFDPPGPIFADPIVYNGP